MRVNHEINNELHILGQNIAANITIKWVKRNITLLLRLN